MNEFCFTARGGLCGVHVALGHSGKLCCPLREGVFYGRLGYPGAFRFGLAVRGARYCKYQPGKGAGWVSGDLPWGPIHVSCLGSAIAWKIMRKHPILHVKPFSHSYSYRAHGTSQNKRQRNVRSMSLTGVPLSAEGLLLLSLSSKTAAAMASNASQSGDAGSGLGTGM